MIGGCFCSWIAGSIVDKWIDGASYTVEKYEAKYAKNEKEQSYLKACETIMVDPDFSKAEIKQ